MGENTLRTATAEELKAKLGEKRAQRRETQERKAALDLELSRRQKQHLDKERMLYKCETALEQLEQERGANPRFSER